MIIDIHTHAFPASIRQSRQIYFDAEPAFELLYKPPKSRLAGAAEIVAMMDEQKVDKSVIFGFPWRSADTFKRHNDYILEAVNRFPNRLIGFCCLDPMHPDAPAEVERCLKNGMSGIGELAFYTSGIDESCLHRLEPIMKLAESHNRPVMLHTNEPVGHYYPGKSPNTLIQIYTLIRRFKQNKIILAHWGGGLFFYSLLRKDVREALGNIWFDTAASPYLYEQGIYNVAIQTAGIDKILLGSDFPLLGPGRYLNEMRAAGLSPDQLEAVCGLNAANLLALTD